jgi:hypothetical protein
VREFSAGGNAGCLPNWPALPPALNVYVFRTMSKFVKVLFIFELIISLVFFFD